MADQTTTDQRQSSRAASATSITQAMRDMLAQPCFLDVEGRTYQEALAQAMLDLAIQGNASAIREVFRRLDGPPPEHAANADIRTIADLLDDAEKE